MRIKIAVLSRSPKLYSTKRLVEAGKALGHEVDIIDTLHCYMDITSNRPAVRYDGKPLPAYDALIPRIGASITFYGTSVVRQFEMMGGAPVVVKLVEGTQGIGVVLADTNKAAESIIEAFMGLKANILVQEYIKEAGGADIRCFVVGGKVVAAMKRQAAEGEFRSNLHRGGEATLVRLGAEERATAVNAAKIMGLNVCGVDILQSRNGPVVMEVNSSPGLEGIENATGKDVADMIFSFIEKNARPNNTRTKEKG